EERAQVRARTAHQAGSCVGEVDGEVGGDAHRSREEVGERREEGRGETEEEGRRHEQAAATSGRDLMSSVNQKRRASSSGFEAPVLQRVNTDMPSRPPVRWVEGADADAEAWHDDWEVEEDGEAHDLDLISDLPEEAEGSYLDELEESADEEEDEEDETA